MAELILVDADALEPFTAEVLGEPAPWRGDERSLYLAMKQKKAVLAGVALVHEVRSELGSEVWRLHGPVVREDSRRQGQGRRLVQAAQAVAEKRGGGLWARVPLESLPFYSSLGFRALADEGQGDEDLVLSWRPKA